MTKNDIAVELCKRIPDLEKSTAIHLVDNVVDVLSDAFVRGDNVYLRGFGSLEVKTTKEKMARNIHKGTAVVVPVQRTVKFRLSKQLKSRMNNGTVD